MYNKINISELKNKGYQGFFLKKKEIENNIIKIRKGYSNKTKKQRKRRPVQSVAQLARLFTGKKITFCFKMMGLTG